MKREIVIRITRIVLILTFLLVASFSRQITYESYEKVNDFRESVQANIQIVNMEKGVIPNHPVSDKQGTQSDGYKLEIKNYALKSKTFTFTLINNIQDENTSVPFDNVKYQILKNGKILTTDKVSETGKLYVETLKENETSNYEIKFWITNDSDTDLNNKKFSSKIALI